MTPELDYDVQKRDYMRLKKKYYFGFGWVSKDARFHFYYQTIRATESLLRKSPDPETKAKLLRDNARAHRKLEKMGIRFIP